MRPFKVLHPKELEASVTLIDELGITKIAREISLSPQAVFNWKSKGIPPAWKLYFKTKHKAAYKRAFNSCKDC